MTGEKLRFSVGAALTSGTPGDPCKYTVCVAPLTLQVLQIEPTHSPLNIQAFLNHHVYGFFCQLEILISSQMEKCVIAKIIQPLVVQI